MPSGVHTSAWTFILSLKQTKDGFQTDSLNNVLSVYFQWRNMFEDGLTIYTNYTRNKGSFIPG